MSKNNDSGGDRVSEIDSGIHRGKMQTVRQGVVKRVRAMKHMTMSMREKTVHEVVKVRVFQMCLMRMQREFVNEEQDVLHLT